MEWTLKKGELRTFVEFVSKAVTIKKIGPTIVERDGVGDGEDIFEVEEIVAYNPNIKKLPNITLCTFVKAFPHLPTV
ncbi:hypothetical protein LXL04_028915 [Taraxacum kok-saghyz]